MKIDIHTHVIKGGTEIFDASGCEILPAQALCSVGVHPLYIHSATESVLHRIETLAQTGGIVAIGEVGLDRNASAVMDEQLRIFEEVIKLSEKYELPLIVHCVRAYPELLQLHNRYKPKQAWIIHGYNNNGEILSELLRHGCFVAVGKAVMEERSNIYRLLPEIPFERLFFETDDSSFCIEAIYMKAAKRLDIDVELLEGKVYDNYLRLNILGHGVVKQN